MRFCSPLFTVAALIFGSASSLEAQFTWSGAVDGTFGTGGNWTGNAAPAGTLPTPTSTLSFATTPNPAVTVGTSVNVSSMSFTSTAPNYVFSGSNGATLGLGSGGITVNSASTGTITFSSSLPVQLLANQTWSTPSNFSVSGNISGSAALTISGGGTVILAGTNTYTGGTNAVSASALTLLNSTSLPTSGNVTVTGGSYVGVGAVGMFGTLIGKIANKTSGTVSGVPGFNGSLGFDTVSTAVTPTNFNDAIGFSAFNGNSNFDGIGSSTRAILSGAISVANNQNYKFGGGQGVLYITSSLAAAGTAGLTISSSTTSTREDEHLTVFLQGNNTFTGNVSVTASSLIFDGPNALLSTATPTFTLGDDGYIGYTESSSFDTFAAFLTKLKANSLTYSNTDHDAIIGIDSHNNAAPRPPVSDPIDLSSLSSQIFLGSATNVTLTGTIKPPSTGALFLTGVSGGYLRIDSALTAANITAGVTVGFRESESGDATFQGYVDLRGASTYTGSTSLQSGYLLLGASSTPTSGTVTFGPIGTGTLVVPSNATKAALAASDDGITIANNLSVASPGLQFGIPATSISDDLAFPLQSLRNNSLTLSGIISGAGRVTYVGGGTLTLTGTSTYTGGTTINSGTVVINADTNLGTAPGSATPASLTLNGGTLQTTASVTLATNRGISLGASGGTISPAISTTLAYGGVITGTGSLTATGSGILSLSGSNPFSGGLAINGGAISVGSDASLGSSTGALSLNNGTLITTANLTLGASRGVSLGALGGGFSPASGTTLTIPNAISGSGALTKYNSGTLSLSGTNTYSGGTVVNFGTLQIAAGGALPAGQNVAINAIFGGLAELDLNTVSSAIGALTFGGAGSTPTSTNNLVIATGGSLTLGGNVTYLSTNGPLGSTISGGTLALGATRTFNVSDSAGTTGGAPDLYISSIISGTSLGLVKTGNGLMGLGGANTYTGGTTINDGIIYLAASSTLPSGGDVTINNIVGTTSYLTINPSLTESIGALTFGGASATGSSSNNVSIGTNSTLTLGGNVTYDANNNPLGASISAASGGTLALGGATRTFNVDDSNNASADLSVGAAITGAGTGIVKTGAGTLTLSGANTYTGATTISGGTLTVANASALGSTASGTTVSTSGTLVINNVTVGVEPLVLNGGGANGSGSLVGLGTASFAGPITLASNSTIGTSGSTDSLTLSGIISGSFGLAKQGSGSLTLSGQNTYSGNTDVIVGTLVIGANNALPATTAVTLYGQTLDVAHDQTISQLLIFSPVFVNSQVILRPLSTLTVNVPSSTTDSYGGSITGGGSLAKAGTGTLTLSGANSYTGTTTINGGALSIGSIGNGGSNSVVGASTSPAANLVIDGGTLIYTGANQATDRLFTIGSTATIDASGTGSLSFTNPGSLAFTSGSTSRTLVLQGANTGANTLASIVPDNAGFATALTKSGAGSWTLLGANTYTGPTGILGGTLAISSDANLGAAPSSPTAGQLVLNGGTLSALGGVTLNANRGVSLGAGGGTFNVTSPANLTIAGVIVGSGPLSVLGGGTLTLSGANTYTGATSITQGSTLAATDAGALSPTSSVAVTFGTLSIGASQTIAGISGSSPGNVAIAGSQTLTLNTTANNSFGGAISGSGALAKNGTGNLTLTGDSTYGGGTTVNAGNLILANAGPSATGSGGVSVVAAATLTIGQGNATGSVAGDIANAGSVVYSRSDSVTYSGVLSGNGAFAKQGAGTVTLTGNSVATGTTTVNAGTLSIGNGGTSGALAGNIANNAALTFNRSDAAAYSGVISGSGTVTKNGGGTLTLSGANNFTGTTTVSSGTLSVANATGLGNTSAGTVVNTAATLDLNNVAVGNEPLSISGFGSAGVGAITGTGTSSLSGPITLTGLSGPNNPGNAIGGTGSLTLSGAIGDGGNGLALTKLGTGTLTLTGQGTYGGATTLVSGTLKVGVTNALPATTLLSFAPGTTLDVLNDQTIAGFLTPGTGSSIALALSKTLTVSIPAANTFTSYDGALTGAGNFTVTGLGGDIVNLTGTVGSNVTASAGAGATLIVGSAPFTVTAPLSFVSNGTQTVSNVISGSGSIVASLGTTVLTGNNNYTGGTVVNGGKLIVNNSLGSATGTGLVVVNSGAVFGGSGFITGPVTLNNGAIIAPGNSPGTLSVGPTTFSSGARFSFEINNAIGIAGTNWDLLSISGALTMSATPASPFVLDLTSLTAGNAAGLLVNFNNTNPYAWQFISTTGGITGFSASAFQFNTNQFQNSLGASGSFFVSQAGNDLFVNFTPVPEPSTLALLATGLGALAFSVRRRRAR